MVQTQWETRYTCKLCKNVWSGGSMGVAQQDPNSVAPVAVPTPPEDDYPAFQFTGSSFRDPGKNFGGGEGED